MPDRLDKCYYWHIITLAKMKCKLRSLKGVDKLWDLQNIQLKDKKSRDWKK